MILEVVNEANESYTYSLLFFIVPNVDKVLCLYKSVENIASPI